MHKREDGFVWSMKMYALAAATVIWLARMGTAI